MKTDRMLLILLSAVSGCTREPQDTAFISPEGPSAAQVQEHREVIGDVRKLVVIGQVIGTHGERVSGILRQAGVSCIVQGDEFHEIAVPRDNRQEAIGVVANDARQTGYEIIWRTQ